MEHTDRLTARDPGAGALFDALGAPITATPISLLYRVSLIVVAAAMVLLPLLYVGLIVLTAYVVLWHVLNNAWLITRNTSVVFSVISYCGPIAAGAILIFFMVKPFFARLPEPEGGVSLDPEREPLLFSLIQRICTAIGAPVPVRVQVDHSVNAAASLTGGRFKLIRRQLTLTIGLPLAAGLTMQQLTGILAHEFGHFAQGAGMRLTYAIRTVNHWFWRVVYERDEWDDSLATWSRTADVRIGVVLWLARGAVSASRRVLWALMMLGHIISCFMLRQMEYDADSYSIKVAGSNNFVETMAAVQELDAAARMSSDDVAHSWRRRRLPDDLAALVVWRRSRLPSDFERDEDRKHVSRKLELFATHPSDRQRVDAARRMAAPGVFRRTNPASELFDDFEQLSRLVTRHYYERVRRLDMRAFQLVDASETIQESGKAADAMQALQRLFNNAVSILRPIVLDPAPNSSAALGESSSTSAAARHRFSELEKKKIQVMAARELIAAGYPVRRGDFGISADTTASPDAVIQEISDEQGAVLSELVGYERFIGQRLTAASQSATIPQDYGLAMFQTLTALNVTYGDVVALHQRLAVFDQIIAFGQTRQNYEPLNRYVFDLEGELRTLVDRIRKKLSATPNPFGHAGSMTVVDYLRGHDITTEDAAAVIQDARSHVGGFFELYWRIVGVLALAAEQAEVRAEH